MTPLHIVASKGFVDPIQLLVSRGADMNVGGLFVSLHLTIYFLFL